MDDVSVKGLMVPIEEYAVVDSSASLADALAALERTRRTSPPGRQPHRAVLLRAPGGAILGKLDHAALMRAFLPEGRPWGHENALAAAGVDEDMRRASSAVLGLFEEELDVLCGRMRGIRAADVRSPASASIGAGDSPLEAVRAFQRSGSLSLLVVEGGGTVGVLRLADLFDALAARVLAASPGGPGEAGP